VPDGEQGRSYDIWRCPECLEQVEPPGHGDYAVPTVAGHYHDGDTPDPQPEDWDGPYDRWVPGERIRVCEHPTDGEGADERKWTRAFTRLEKAVQRHRDAKGWTDDADDELHRVLDKVLRDVGPAPPDAGGSEAREVAEELRDWLGQSNVSSAEYDFLDDLADRLDRAPSPNNSKDRQTLGVREGPTREQIIEAITPTLGAWLKLTGLHVPKIAGQCADAVLALYPTEGEGE
jgi:hypothetical protein